MEKRFTKYEHLGFFGKARQRTYSESIVLFLLKACASVKLSSILQVLYMLLTFANKIFKLVNKINSKKAAGNVNIFF